MKVAELSAECERLRAALSVASSVISVLESDFKQQRSEVVELQGCRQRSKELEANMVSLVSENKRLNDSLESHKNEIDSKPFPEL